MEKRRPKKKFDKNAKPRHKKSGDFKGKRNGKPKRRNGGRSGRGGRKPSQLDPTMLIKKASKVKVKKYQTNRTFNEYPISAELLERLTQKGFSEPTEIQDKSIEALLDGHDLLGIAQTGTGKTGAFLIPIIEHLLYHYSKDFALVVVPTRELALQVQEEFKSMTKGLKLFSSVFIGGTKIHKDIQALRRPSHLVIGTPGRILDLVQRKALDLRGFNTLVLDEYDRMLDMGFSKDVLRIVHLMQNRTQTMLFSATLDKKQQSIIDDLLDDPVSVKVSSGDTSADQVDQDIIRLEEGMDKFQYLLDLLRSDEYDKVIVFDETKHRVNRLCGKLNKAGIRADQIQGNKSQTQRQKALRAFKQGRVDVLVATDVAARGIDVDDVALVINYQMPMTYDAYIHRIGRTGRAGKVGKALTFVS